MSTDKTELPAPPKGARQVETGLDNQPAHDWDKTPLIEGDVIKVKEVELADRRTGELRNVRYAIVDKGNEDMVKLWETKSLEELFNLLKPGMRIWVLYKSSTKLDGGRTLREFDAYII